MPQWITPAQQVDVAAVLGRPAVAGQGILSRLPEGRGDQGLDRRGDDLAIAFGRPAPVLQLTPVERVHDEVADTACPPQALGPAAPDTPTVAE